MDFYAFYQPHRKIPISSKKHPFPIRHFLAQTSEKKTSKNTKQKILVRPRRSRLQKDTVYVQALENNELT